MLDLPSDRKVAIDPPMDGFLDPGRNVWRVEHTQRAAVLVDGAAYFLAVREAMLQARHTIHIVGWDLDSRMRLVGPSGECDDGLPETLAAFLSALVARRPGLRIRLLLWDYSLVFSLQRELMPLLSFLWRTPPQIEICLDDTLPIGASHHQKIVVIDDAVAFSGGLDLTSRRWDTADHRPDDPLRVDPAGEAYPPFHDVQMVVDGDAAAALGELVRQRWQNAACESLRGSARKGADPDLWPASVTPDFRQLDIGIARTFAPYDRQPAVSEVAELFGDMIDAAERLIFIENQFLTHAPTAERLARRLQERPELEAVIVVPGDYDGWVERQVMLGGRLRFMRILEEAGCADRVRLVFPEVRTGEATAAVMVHSKVMIVDDRMLRIGSANLCNRSMGFDSECDLVIVARDEQTRRAIVAVRDRLLAEHSGEGEHAASTQRRLVPVRDAESGMSIDDPLLDSVADPLEPITGARKAAERPSLGSRLGLAVKVGAFVAVVALLASIWQLSPVSDPAGIARSIGAIADRPWGPAAVIAVFLLAECVAFPVTLLILGTITVFGGWSGALLAGLGAMSSAMASYWVGRHIGSRVLRRVIGPRINRVRRGLMNRGVLAVASVRVVPVAPFTVVNLVAGAVGLRFFDFAAGTALGLLPGILVMSALGQQITNLLTEPTTSGVLTAIGFVVLWVLLGFTLQFLVARYRARQ